MLLVGRLALWSRSSFSAPLGLADMDPVGGLVAGTGEALGIDKGFQQDRSVGVAVVPVWGSFRAAMASILEARFWDSTQGRMRKRALLTISGRFLSRSEPLQSIKRSRGAVFQASAPKPRRARMRSWEEVK